jgi:hypothetical protein
VTIVAAAFTPAVQPAVQQAPYTQPEFPQTPAVACYTIILIIPAQFRIHFHENPAHPLVPLLLYPFGENCDRLAELLSAGTHFDHIESAPRTAPPELETRKVKPLRFPLAMARKETLRAFLLRKAQTGRLQPLLYRPLKMGGVSMILKTRYPVVCAFRYSLPNAGGDIRDQTSTKFGKSFLPSQAGIPLRCTRRTM